MDVSRCSAAVLLVSLMAVASLPAYGQVFQPYPPVVIEESARLVIPDPAYPDTHDVAIDGNRIVVGALRIEHELDLNHDVAVLFERSPGGSWAYVTTLLEQDSQSFGHQAIQVAIEGNVIAATTGNMLHVFEYTASGWVPTAVLAPPPGVSGIGSDVEIDSGTILVGGQSGNYQAIAFRKNASGQWQAAGTLTGGPGPADDEFHGGDVDISGGSIVIGSPRSTSGYRDEVYVFQGPVAGPWSLQQVMTNPPSDPVNRFGSGVSIDGDDAIVAGSADTGVPLFNRRGPWGWTETTFKIPDGLTAGILARVKMRDGRALLAFPQDEDRGANTGSINVFVRPDSDPTSYWFEHVARLLPSDAPQRFIGSSLDSSGRTVVASGRGATYVFELPATFDRHQRNLETFEDGAADNWLPQGIGAWSVVRAADSTVYRQTSTADGARSLLTGADWTNQAIEADIRPLTFDGSDRWVGTFVRYTDANNYYYVTLRSSNVLQLRRIVNGSFVTLASVPLTVTAGRSYRVRLEAIGTWLRVYVDGRLLLETRDTAHTHGLAGLAMYKTSAEFDNVVVGSNPSLTMVGEDFEDQLAQGWTPAGEGSWSFPVDGTRVYRQTSVVGGARSVVGDPTVYDQVIEADIKALSFSGSDRWFGLVTRYDEEQQQYCYVTLRSSNRVALRRVQGDQVVELDSAPFTIAAGTSYHVRLDAIGDHLRVYIDGRLVLEATDFVASTMAGKAGFAMYKTVAEIDNVRVSQP